MKSIGIAADHGGFLLKEQLTKFLKTKGYEVLDFGAYELDNDDDYPDFIIPLAKAVVNEKVFRGIAICGSGVGACITANKIPGARAALISDSFSAHQGVEDDNMNIICLGSRVIGSALACDLMSSFLNAIFMGDERFKRRLAKIEALENEEKS